MDMDNLLCGYDRIGLLRKKEGAAKSVKRRTCEGKGTASAARQSQGQATAGILSIHDLAKMGDLAALESLLKKGGDVNLRDASGGTVLHAASWCGQVETVQWLLDYKADQALTDALGQTALDLALSAGHERVAEILTARLASNDTTSLHRAAAAGSVGLLKILLAKGQDVNAKDDAGRTALHVAASRGHLEVVRTLLAAKAGSNTTDNRGLTPLHAAVRVNQAECVTALLEAVQTPILLMLQAGRLCITRRH